MESLAKQIDDYKEDIIAVVDFITFLEKNTNSPDYEILEQKFESILDKLPKVREIFVNMILEYNEIIEEILYIFDDMKKYMTIEEIEKAENEIQDFGEKIETFNNNFKTFLKNKESLDLAHIYFSLNIISCNAVLVANMLTLYDKYLDYIPLEKMPKTFPDGQRKSFDITDDILFIDDMD